MSHLPSLPEPIALLDVFRAFPESARPLIAYHEILLRGPSDLSVAEREMIAAFVSALNACAYCHGVHAATAEAFGVEAALLASLVDDLEAAPVDSRLKPILRLAAKLTREPSRVHARDAEAVYAAGWSERALHDAVSVCALFNMMNRLVEGLGVTGGPGYFATSAARLHEQGYGGLLGLLGGENRDEC